MPDRFLSIIIIIFYFSKHSYNLEKHHQAAMKIA